MVLVVVVVVVTHYCCSSLYGQEMRHLEALQERLVAMEAGRARRERRLEHLLVQQQAILIPDSSDSDAQWRTLVDEKNREIDRFRAELDAILDVLRQLHSQGVVVPFRRGNVPPLNQSLR